MKLVSGSSNPELAANLAHILNIEHIPVQIAKFANGEKRVWIQAGQKIRGENVILVQSFSHPTDEQVMEFLLIADALERLGARHVNLVLPWMGYSLQDKVFRPGEPIAAKVIANLVSNAYIKRCFLLDLHNTSTPGFFSVPTEHLSALQTFAEHVRSNYDLEDAVVASPDFGGLKRARVFATELGVSLVNIDKHRDLVTGKVTAQGLHGNVFGKTVFIFDDAILSGGTVVEAAQILKEHSAKKIIFLATHGLFVKKAQDRLQDSVVDKVVVTNSIYQKTTFPKLEVIDMAPLFAEGLKTWM